MIKNLYKEATSSKGTLPFSNYFDVKDGFKKNLKKWKYDYQESFNFDEAIKVNPLKEITIPYMGEMHGYNRPVYTNDRYLFPYYPPYILNKLVRKFMFMMKRLFLMKMNLFYKLKVSIMHIIYLLIKNMLVLVIFHIVYKNLILKNIYKMDIMKLDL